MFLYIYIHVFKDIILVHWKSTRALNYLTVRVRSNAKKGPEMVHTMSTMRYEHSHYAGRLIRSHEHPNKCPIYTERGNGINEDT